jgi:hypothetical protein
VTLGARSRVFVVEGNEDGEGVMMEPGSVANLFRRERPRSAALRYSEEGGVLALEGSCEVGC